MSVWEVIAGDPERGARQLIDDYGARLYATAFRLCLNECDAEDLVQRTLVRVVERIGSFSGKSSFFTWMCSILVNFRKMDVRRKAANALVFEENDIEVPDERPDPCECLALDDEAAALRMAVEGLPEEMRTIVVMHYFNSICVPDVARILKIPEGTVYYKLHEARGKIRDCLSKVFSGRGIKPPEGAKRD